MTAQLTKAALDRFEAFAREATAHAPPILVTASDDDGKRQAAWARYMATASGEAPATIAALREAVEMLRGLEWSGIATYGEGNIRSACPACDGWRPPSIEARVDVERVARAERATLGHATDCALAAFLRRFS